MPRTLSVFCDSNAPLGEILTAMGEAFKITFSSREIEGVGVVHESTYDGGAIIAFSGHGLEDDGGIEFTRYPIEIDLSGAESESDLLKIGLTLAQQVSEQFRCATLVVDNLQQLKATFPPACGFERNVPM